MLRQQPGRVLAAVGKDALKLYAVDRVTAPGDTPVSRWQFQSSYPQYPPYMTIRGGQVLFKSFIARGRGQRGRGARRASAAAARR